MTNNERSMDMAGGQIAKTVPVPERHNRLESRKQADPGGVPGMFHWDVAGCARTARQGRARRAARKTAPRHHPDGEARRRSAQWGGGGMGLRALDWRRAVPRAPPRRGAETGAREMRGRGGRRGKTGRAAGADGCRRALGGRARVVPASWRRATAAPVASNAPQFRLLDHPYGSGEAGAPCVPGTAAPRPPRSSVPGDTPGIRGLHGARLAHVVHHARHDALPSRRARFARRHLRRLRRPHQAAGPHGRPDHHRTPFAVQRQ